MYSVIEFDESKEGNGGLAIINTQWLTPRKHEVLWPPIKDQKQFNKLLSSNAEADATKWKLYSIRRCFYATGNFTNNLL